MDSMNIYDGISNIGKVWNILFMPVVLFLITITVIYWLRGKDVIKACMEKNKLLKVDGTYYKQRHILTKEKKERKTILVPIKEYERLLLSWIAKNPLIVVLILIFIIYTLYKIATLLEIIIPTHSVYRQERMLLFSLDDYHISNIWAYYPNDSLDQIYDRIFKIAKDNADFNRYKDRSFEYGMRLVSKMVFSLATINLFIPSKKNIRRILKTMILLVGAFGLLVLSHYIDFKKSVDELQQTAYYALNELELENSEPIAEYIIEERERKIAVRISDINNEMFYGAFDISIGEGKYSFYILENIQNYMSIQEKESNL